MKRYWQRFWSWSNRTRTKRYMKAYNLLGDPSLNKNGVRVLSIPVICGPTTIKVKNPHLIPVSWSATGDYSLSNQTDTSVVVSPSGLSVGSITLDFEGLASITESLTTCNLTLSGPTTVCTSNTTFSLNNLQAGYTVSWTHSSNLTYVGSTSGSITVRAKGALYSGSGWVEATVSGPCGATPPVRHTVWVGTPLSPLTLWNIFDGEMFEDNTQYTFRVDPAPLEQGVFQPSWSVSGAASIVSGANSLNVWVLTDDTHYNPFTVSAAYTNGCGTGLTTSATGYIQGAIGPGGIIVEGMYSVYPNPVVSEVTIATQAEADRKAGEEKRALPQPIQRIRIYDRAGNLKRSRSYPVSERVTLNVSDLPGGNYLIQINDLPAHPIVKH